MSENKVDDTAVRLLLTRRSTSLRLLAPPAPTPAELTTILTVAARVPDHGRAVPWRFVVIDRGGAIRLGDFIADIYLRDHPDADAERLASERHRLLRAPLVVAVVACTHEHPKATEWEQILSTGAAAMNLVIAANALGYGANWHTEWYAYDDRFAAALGLDATERIAGLIHIGTPTEAVADRPRPALSDVVTVYGTDGPKPFSAQA
jgi:nitroreductase